MKLKHVLHVLLAVLMVVFVFLQVDRGPCLEEREVGVVHRMSPHGKYFLADPWCEVDGLSTKERYFVYLDNAMWAHLKVGAKAIVRHRIGRFSGQRFAQDVEPLPAER